MPWSIADMTIHSGGSLAASFWYSRCFGSTTRFSASGSMCWIIDLEVGVRETVRPSGGENFFAADLAMSHGRDQREGCSLSAARSAAGMHRPNAAHGCMVGPTEVEPDDQADRHRQQFGDG